jgi:hypothetical protein
VHILLMLSLAAAPASEIRATLTQLTAVAAANLEGAEVLSSRDIQNIIALEAEKELAGCSDASQCLAEVAGALGARLVIFGELGHLDDQLILTLNLYDADQSRSVGRTVMRGTSSSEVSAQLDEAVAKLIKAPLDAIEDKPARVLVMDILGGAAPGPDGEPGEAPAGPMSTMQIGGLAAAGTGVLAIGVGAIFGGIASGLHGDATDSSTLQKDVPDLIDARNTNGWIANGLFVGGAALAVAGGALYAVGGE